MDASTSTWNTKNTNKLRILLLKHGKDWPLLQKKFPDQRSSSVTQKAIGLIRSEKLILPSVKADDVSELSDAAEETKENADYFDDNDTDDDDASVASKSTVAPPLAPSAMRYFPLPLGEFAQFSHAIIQTEGQRFHKGVISKVGDKSMTVRLVAGGEEVLKLSSDNVFVVSNYFFENHIDGSVLYPRPGTICKINGKSLEIGDVYPDKITFAPKVGKVGISYPDNDLNIIFTQNQKPADRPLNKLLGVRELFPDGSKKKASVFSVRILFSGISFDLGQYEDKVTAAEVYDCASKFLLGEDAELNFPSEVKTAADLNLDLMGIIADTKSALQLTGSKLAAVLEPDFRNLKELVMEEQGVKGKAPDSPAWTFQTEVQELSKSSGKRRRKNVQVFSPTFLCDRRMNEIREAENSQVDHIKKMQLALLDPNDDEQYMAVEKKTPSKGKKLVFREETPSPQESHSPQESDYEEELTEREQREEKKQSVSERRKGKTAIKLEWFMDVQIGTEVEANWEKTGNWYAGKIASIDWDSEVISVAYDDGDFEQDIDRTRVRVLVEKDVYKAYLQKRTDIKKMRTKERKKAEKERTKAKRAREKADRDAGKVILIKPRPSKEKKEPTKKQIEIQGRRSEELLLQAEAAGFTIDREHTMTQRQLDAIKEKLMKHQKDQKERHQREKERKARKKLKKTLQTRDDFPDFEQQKENDDVQEMAELASFTTTTTSTTTATTLRDSNLDIQWPRRGAFVRVKYEKWYFGRVREIQKEVGRIVIEFDHGEVYAEEYPGAPEEDLVIISYTEYKRNRDKNLRINAQIRMLNESNGVLWGREGLKARNRIKQLLNREKNTLESDSSDDEPLRQASMGATDDSRPTSSLGANLLMMTANKVAEEEATEFKGVFKKGLSYIAKISYGSKTFNIGLFPNKQAAALAHDDVYFDMYGSAGCNESFPEEVLGSNISPVKAMSEKSKSELVEESGLIGVTRLANDDWRAAFAARSIATCDEDVIELGTYENKEDALRAYDQMCLGLRGQFAICNEMEMNANVQNMIVEDRSEAEGIAALRELAPSSEGTNSWGQKRRKSSVDMESDKFVSIVVDGEEDKGDKDDDGEVISSKDDENYISTGVFKSASGLWCARIIQDNQLYDLGSFETPQEASSSYENARTFFAKGKGADVSKKKIDMNTKAIHLSPSTMSPSFISSPPGAVGMNPAGNFMSNAMNTSNTMNTNNMGGSPGISRELELTKALAEKDEQIEKMQMGMGMGMGMGMPQGQQMMAPEQQQHQQQQMMQSMQNMMLQMQQHQQQTAYFQMLQQHQSMNGNSDKGADSPAK